MHILLKHISSKHSFLSHHINKSTTCCLTRIMATALSGTPKKTASSPWAIEVRKLSKSPKRFNFEPAEHPGEVVLVTGGAGFLGQHIVKHLLEQREFPVHEVRVFDTQPLKWFHGLDGTDVSVPLRQYQGDICNMHDLLNACDGATVLIHNASIVDTFTNPDMERLHRINVQGTENIIQTCLTNNVKYVLYTSSIAAKDKLGAYGITKRQAEDLVLEANGRQTKSSQILRTCALRPVGMFGEGDVSLVLNGLKNISGSTFTRVGDDLPRFQTAYAGNVAWAFVMAIRRFRETATETKTPGHLTDPAGHAVGVGDATPVSSYNRFMQPYVLQTGSKMSNYYLPFWVLNLAASLCEWLCYLLRPIYSLRLPLTKAAVTSMSSLPIVHADEANKYFGYKPLYSEDESHTGCLRYYKHAYEAKENNLSG